MPAMADNSNFNDVLNAAMTRMNHCYQDVPTHFWVDRTAFTHRFDNLRHMASRSATDSLSPLLAQQAIVQELAAATRTALYLGVPWCIQTCSFCDLAYSRSPRVEEKREYIEVILKELDIYNAAGLASVPAGSIYFCAVVA